MFTEAQVHYIEDVLGASTGYFRASPAPPSAPVEVVILTLPLSSQQEALLGKILASVQLSGYRHVQVAEAKFESPEAAVHVLAFFGLAEDGRLTHSESVWWSLPSLAEMTGSDASVVEKKKAAWVLLQQFAKELKA